METAIITFTLVGMAIWAVLSRLKENEVDAHKEIVSYFGCFSLVIGIGGMVLSSFIIGIPFLIPATVNLFLSIIITIRRNKVNRGSGIGILDISKFVSVLWCITVLFLNL